MNEPGKPDRVAALQAFMMGDFPGAIAAYGRALALDASDREALRGLAMAHGQAGDVAGAVGWAEKLTAAAPDDTLSWATLSMLLQKQGRIADAEAAQAKARVLGWKSQLKPG